MYNCKFFDHSKLLKLGKIGGSECAILELVATDEFKKACKRTEFRTCGDLESATYISKDVSGVSIRFVFDIYSGYICSITFRNGDFTIDISYTNRYISRVAYYYKGLYHRLDGPADIRYLRDLEIRKRDKPDTNIYGLYIEYEVYNRYGNVHRPNGPAVITYYGDKVHGEYWINNQRITKEAFFERQKKVLDY